MRRRVFLTQPLTYIATMIKLILAFLFLMVCYAIYQRLKSQAESRYEVGASNKRNTIDPRQAVEAEYRVIEDDGEAEENG